MIRRRACGVREKDGMDTEELQPTLNDTIGHVVVHHAAD